MEERKSMGSALVDVFDAGVVLVKSEIGAVAKKVGEVAKAKGIGVVLLIAAAGPLILGLIFLILAIFYGLIRLGLGAWVAALIIALVSLAVTAGLAMMGLKKLGQEVDTGLPKRRVDMSEIEGKSSQVAVDGKLDPTKSGVPASSLRFPVPAGAGAGVSVPAGAAAATASGSADGYAKVRVEDGSTTVPVYESDPDGRAHMYGDRLNERLEGDSSHGGSHGAAVRSTAGGIPVSTTPTFREDMRREGLDVDDVPRGSS
ncbi:Putative Holin-X, holin superfamily III [Deinococcus reticulitermitis]|uniref:Putative Holin-X, holin superfamily III n=1 Tax=Deinococcus reticulitermitis TaxID=856736 RepID=A0A1H6WC97_9DEIO|nr:phage holin family protein [Deinococcus reticulitermitis]SEJ14503.1 Putative Holin-X, holin superfamily III [Deinococcus reticulitermitis]